MPDIVTIIPELFGSLSSEEGKKWYVVYTKPKREKKLAEYALNNDVQYYLPLIDSIKYYERKKVIYKKPMFHSYVFVKVNHTEKTKLTVSGHTVCFIGVKDETELLDELTQIYKVRLAGTEVTNHLYLSEGVKVKFKEGPLEGVVGMVTDAKNMQKVVLKVDILKRAIAVTAERKNLEIIE